MKKLTMDLESRSACDLRACGMYRYAEDPTTDIMCFAFKFEHEAPMLWIPQKFRALLLPHFAAEKDLFLDDDQINELIEEADLIEAHNLGFERSMWREIMHKRYGFKDLPFEKLRCSAAKAASFSLPRALGDACKALKLPIQKDDIGYKIMLKMCKPRKPKKGERKDILLWHENATDFEKLCRYCMQDTVAEEVLSENIPDLSEGELEVWRHDQVINSRGISVDLPAIRNIMDKVKTKEAVLLMEVQTLTNGAINSARQVKEMRSWLSALGVELVDLKASTVESALADPNIPAKARRLLEIRQSLSKSSVSKLEAMLNMACADGRVRGTILYYGARTGRFSGKGVQPQNLPRDSYDEDTIAQILSLPLEMVEMLYGCMLQVASRCIRGMLIASPGKKLKVADFAAIEARVLAWLANEQKALHTYRSGRDIYKINAVDIYGVRYDDVDKDQRQIGKVAELALGYQGWLGAFLSMAETYGVVVEPEKAKDIILKWREARPNTVALWEGLEAAAMMAVKTGKAYSYGKIKFGIRGRFLHCRLPSGRLLSYCDPGTATITVGARKIQKEVVTFWGVSSDDDKLLEGTKTWGRIATYGGKLTENIIQALSRDLLVHGMSLVEKEGYDICIHVHDEVISEADDTKALNKFEELLTVTPAWAEGLPLGAEGWEGFRYRK